MIALVLVTEAQRTQQMITLLIGALLVVAVLLIGLTIWYWRHTDPRRYARRVFPEPEGHDLDLRQRYAHPQDGNGQSPFSDGRWPDHDPYRDPRQQFGHHPDQGRYPPPHRR